MIVLLTLLVLLQSCAHITPLTGGPEDKDPPFLTGVFPGPESVSVPVDAPIVLEFNEWISPNISASQMQFSPPLERIPKIEIRANRIMITPRAPLDSHTTYTVSVGSAIRDLRNNAIPRPFQLVFSTGLQLDSGFLQGRVGFPLYTNKNFRAPYPTIALYPTDSMRLQLRHLQTPDSLELYLDSMPTPTIERPYYTSTTDSNGFFEFKGLREGRYVLLAFQDANNNLIPDIAREDIAIASQWVTIGQDSLFPMMWMRTLDTTQLMLSGAELTGKGGVIIQLNRSLDLRNPVTPENFTLLNEDSTLQQKPDSLFILKHSGFPLLFFSNLQHDSLYILTAKDLYDSTGTGLDSARSFLPVRWSTIADTLPIRHTKIIPSKQDGILHPNSKIYIQFSKPLIFAEWKANLRLVSGNDSLPFAMEQLSPIELLLTVPARLPANNELTLGKLQTDTISYTMDSLTNEPIYTTQNRLDPLVRYNVPSPNQQAQLIMQNVPCNPQLKLFLRKADGANTLRPTCKSETQEWVWTQITEGTYLLDAYWDTNQNDIWDGGDLKPLHPAEPVYIHPVPIEIQRGQNVLDETPLLQWRDLNE